VASPRRIISALGAFFVLALLLAACGGVPGNGVARVDDTVIKKSTFDHWIKVAALSSQTPGSTGGVTIPDAPNYTKCIATKRAQQPKPTAGQPQQTDAQLKAACEQDYKSLQQQVMQFLISAEWIQGEAKDLGIKVINKGISGNKITDLQGRLQKDVLDLKPNIVFIYIGINDVWHWEHGKGTTKEAFIKLH